jgi:hypothetical protein
MSPIFNIKVKLDESSMIEEYRADLLMRVD